MNADKLKPILDKHLAWLRGALDGERADLSRADLSRADLSMADLRVANLSMADLSMAIGTFAVGSFGRHQAIAAGGYISIGCERHEYQHWLDHYAEIGAANKYTEAEIERYGAWIKLVVEWLTAEEKAV